MSTIPPPPLVPLSFPIKPNVLLRSCISRNQLKKWPKSRFRYVIVIEGSDQTFALIG